ncbi:hypothetical protein HYW46_01380 [Candidatus Daviesbacteria bacterium]|nr:hypothetical protein [Candidatus Daviesbacteria bacterium]
MLTKFSANKLKDVLAEPEAPGLDEPYFIIQSPLTKENMTVILSGKNGMEFNKTYGFFHNFQGILIYKTLYGQGIMIIQKNDERGEAKEVRIISLRPGVEIEVPSGYGHTVVNTGKNFLVVVDNAIENDENIDSDIVKSKKGFAYYVVDKKGEIAFEKNPNYSFHPQITSY